MRAAIGRSACARAWAIGPLAWAIGPLAELDGALRPGRAAGARCCSAGRGPGRSGRWPSLMARCDWPLRVCALQFCRPRAWAIGPLAWALRLAALRVRAAVSSTLFIRIIPLPCHHNVNKSGLIGCVQDG